MRVFRLHRVERPAWDFSGSLLRAERWNPAGTALLYTSPALSLACLETLVHLAPDDLQTGYVFSFADLPGDPEIAGYRGDLGDFHATRRFGQRWANQGKSLGIRVPSVIVPIEFNVLLNPLHADYEALAWSEPVRFEFDSRLVRLLS
jgi:RES domain-containing protein